MAKLKALGGDIYAGGFTLGVKQAGFDVVGIVGHDAYGFATHQANFPKIPQVAGRDSWSGKDAGSHYGVDLFYTNPPCALWSSAGMYAQKNSAATANRHKDPRAGQYDDLANYSLEIGAKVWIWETVPNAWTRGREFVLKVLGKHYAKGRHCYIVRFINGDVGVPQTRERLFLITSDKPLVLTPPPGHTVTVGEVWKGLGRGTPLRTSPKLAAFLKAAEPGQKLRSLIGRPDLPDLKPSFLWQVLDPKKRAPTLIGPIWGHPKGRQLTIEEYKAIATFPQNFEVPANAAGVSLLARGVAPLTAKWIAGQVRDNLTGKRKSTYKGRVPEFKVLDFRKLDNIQEEIIHDEVQ